MEDIEQADTNTDYPPMEFTNDMQYYVLEMAKWAGRVAIFGFVLSAMLVALSFFVSALFPALVKTNPALANVPGGSQAIGIFYFIVAALSLSLSFYLFRFSKAAKNGITYNSEEQVTEAFSKLRSFFKLWGIMALSVAALYLLGLIAEIAKR